MRLLIFIIGACFCIKSVAQPIWYNPIEGNTPGIYNPYTIGDTYNTVGLSMVSGIGRSSGLFDATGTDNRYNARSWTGTTSADPDDYFSFILTPNPGYYLNISSFNYSSQTSATGPTSFAVRSSLDGFSSDLGAPSASGGNIPLGSPSFIHMTSESLINGQIEFRIYAWGASNPALGTFSINDFSFNGSVILPIQLSSFTVTQDLHPRLNWTTLSEQNNLHFAIERSSDGINFIEIIQIPGHGTTDKRNDYTYTDFSPYFGINYYRLKQVDMDGTSTTFPMRSVRVFPNTLSVYPTLFHNFIMLNLPIKDHETKWLISDSFGNTCLYGIIPEGNTQDQITVNVLPAGTYFLTIISKYQSKSFKLLKL